MEATEELGIGLIPTKEEYPRIPESSIIRRLHHRLLSLLCIVILLCYISRNNVGFAASDLCAALDLDNTNYGLGVTLFFCGNMIPQLVGNEFTKRLGAPIWLSVLCVAWGSVAMFLGFIQRPAQFYGLMALLGIAQGGAFPAILFYTCTVYPPQFLNGAFAGMTAAVTFSIPVTSLISIPLIVVADAIGLEGWRLLLTVEGALSVIYAVVLFFTLPANPRAASFLTSGEKEWLEEQLQQDDTPSVAFFESLRRVLSNFQVQIASLTVFCSFGVETVLLFFINLSIRTALNGEDQETQDVCGTAGGNRTASIALTAIPYLFSGFVMVLMSFYAHHIRNRKRFALLLQFICAVLLAVWGLANDISFVAGYVTLVLAIGISFPPTVITFSFAAASVSADIRGMVVAFMNFIYSISGLVFPSVIGMVADAYGYGWCIGVTGLLGMVAGLLIMLLYDPISNEPKDIPQGISDRTS